MTTPKTMTKSELLEMLEGLTDETPIVFAHPAGDYWHTTIAGQISEVEEGHIRYNAYHEKFEIVQVEDEDMNDDQHRAIILQ